MTSTKHTGERVTERLFLAVPIPDGVREGLVTAQRLLAGAGARVSWVRPENMHLTLIFLGDVVTSRRPAVQRVLDETVPLFEAFALEARGLGCFGSARSPRILWAGLEGAPPALAEMHGLLTEGFRGLGLDVERRPFRPHLTLGRVRSARGADALTAALGSVNNADFGAVPVHRVLLMQSRLDPQGPRYTALHQVTLKGVAEYAR